MWIAQVAGWGTGEEMGSGRLAAWELEGAQEQMEEVQELLMFAERG